MQKIYGSVRSNILKFCRQNILHPCDNPPIIISKTGKSKIERGITQLRLFDNLGNLKKQQSTAKSKQTSLNISGLTPGIYYLEISDGAYKERQKVVVQYTEIVNTRFNKTIYSGGFIFCTIHII